MAFVLLDLVANALAEEQLAEDEGAHGLHIQTLRLRQDLLISPVDGSTLLLMLEKKRRKQFFSPQNYVYLPLFILDKQNKTFTFGYSSTNVNWKKKKFADFLHFSS